MRLSRGFFLFAVTLFLVTGLAVAESATRSGEARYDEGGTGRLASVMWSFDLADGRMYDLNVRILYLTDWASVDGKSFKSSEYGLPESDFYIDSFDLVFGISYKGDLKSGRSAGTATARRNFMLLGKTSERKTMLFYDTDLPNTSGEALKGHQVTINWVRVENVRWRSGYSAVREMMRKKAEASARATQLISEAEDLLSSGRYREAIDAADRAQHSSAEVAGQAAGVKSRAEQAISTARDLLRRAQEALSGGRWDEAVATARDAVAQDPSLASQSDSIQKDAAARKAGAERAAKDKAAADKAAADKAAAEKTSAEKVASDKLAAQKSKADQAKGMMTQAEGMLISRDWEGATYRANEAAALDPSLSGRRDAVVKKALAGIDEEARKETQNVDESNSLSDYYAPPPDPDASYREAAKAIISLDEMVKSQVGGISFFSGAYLYGSQFVVDLGGSYQFLAQSTKKSKFGLEIGLSLGYSTFTANQGSEWNISDQDGEVYTLTEDHSLSATTLGGRVGLIAYIKQSFLMYWVLQAGIFSTLCKFGSIEDNGNSIDTIEGDALGAYFDVSIPVFDDFNSQPIRPFFGLAVLFSSGTGAKLSVSGGIKISSPTKDIYF